MAPADSSYRLGQSPINFCVDDFGPQADRGILSLYPPRPTAKVYPAFVPKVDAVTCINMRAIALSDIKARAVDLNFMRSSRAN